jgi:hypothetical protein
MFERSEAHEDTVNNGHLQTLQFSLRSISDEEEKFLILASGGNLMELFSQLK